MEKIILTGFSGFLGTHILNFLQKENYAVTKVGRDISSDIQYDLYTNNKINLEADIVIHAAGKAHFIPKTEKEKDDFFKVNYLGTKNLLNSLNSKKLKAIIFISTVAVYGRETGELIDETSSLIGTSPYAKSKIQAENVLIDFGVNNNVKIIILRLPLITGDNPVGNLYNLTEVIKKGYYFRIGEGKAKRSLVSAKDVARVIPYLFGLNGIYNFTDCNHAMICQIDSIIAKRFKRKIKKLPTGLMKLIGKLGDVFSVLPFNSLMFEKLTKSLTFSSDKIFNEINYRPTNGLSDIISKTEKSNELL